MSQMARQFIAFPKPKDGPKTGRKPKPEPAPRPVIKIMDDGREIILLGPKRDPTGEGRTIYRGRIAEMLKRQEGICCLYGFIKTCPGKLLLKDATFEHENGRGAGKHDDRTALPDGTWINGAAHLLCNGEKGSRRIAYNRARNQAAQET
jgi:hypothetical protein